MSLGVASDDSSLRRTLQCRMPKDCPHALATTTGPQRMLYGAVAGLLAGLAAVPLEAMTRGLLGWCVGVAVYQVLSWWLADTFTAADTRQRAQSLDQPNVVILVSMLVVVSVSLVAISMMLQQVKQLEGWERAAHIALGVVALAGSWLMMHTIYAFHYAHRYYIDLRGGSAEGLDFPGKDEPDYFDFMYYAYVVGMTSQVSDVQAITRPMRRLTLIHSILAFAFNMLVLALSVNVVAGAI